MNILEESLKRYENDPLNTDKGQIISKDVSDDNSLKGDLKISLFHF